MSNWNPFHKSVATQSNELATVKVQSAVYGAAIPVVYGTARVPGNLVWYNKADFRAVAQTSKQAVGGKGGTAKVTNTSYTYFAALMMALAHGPISGIGKTWNGQQQDTLDNLRNNDGYSVVLGTHPQSVWSWLTSKHPSEAIPYDGIALVMNQNWPLDSSASIGNWNWEVTGFFPAGGGIVDANPKDVITDILTNTTYGMGWASSLLADLTAYGTYCKAMGLFVGLAATSQQAASQTIGDLLDATMSAPVWSQGQLKIIPYADSAVTGNGVTYTPNTTPLYDLDDDDFLDDGSGELVHLTRTSPSDVDNCVRVEYEDRANDYNKGVQPAQDDALVNLYGERDANTLQYPFLHDAATARTVAQLRLQRTTSILNGYAFTLGWRYVLLEPMDLVTITDVALGLTKHVVRITTIEEDENGKLSVTAEDWPNGIATATQYPHQDWSGSAINTNAAASSVAPPLIFEAPPELTESGQPELWIAVTGLDALWGGADIWMATDDVAFQQIGTVRGGACYGTTTAALPAYSGEPALDTANTLAVQLLGANDQLASGTDTDVAQAVTLCIVDGEFVAFKTATLTGAGAYNLTTLNRGLYNSPSGLHPTSSGFARCDQALLRVPFPQGKRGQTLYFKFTSFNPYGGGQQQLSDVSAYTHTFVGATDAPLKPTPSVDISSAGVVDVDVDAHEYANETRVVIRTDRAPTIDEIVASAFTTGTGVRNGVVHGVATVPPHTKFWIGAVSFNADGVAGDPEIIDSEWLGIGATPLPVVQIGTPVVQAKQIGFPVTMLGSCRRVDLFALPYDADPSPGSSAGVDCESLVPEALDYFEVGENGIQLGVPFTVNVPLLASGHYINLTAVPTDALHQRGISVSAKAQGPGSSPPAAPGKPVLGTPTANASTATATVTAPSSGATIAKWRLYADGKVLQEVTNAAAPGGTQSLSFGPFNPSTSHQLQVSGLTSGGVEGPLADAVTATTTGNTSGGGGGTGTNGKLPTPVLNSGSFSRGAQAVSLNFTFGSGTPIGSNIEVVVLTSATIGGTYTETGYTAVLSPAVVDENQTGSPQIMYFKLLARDPYGRYADSDLSTALAVNIPAGSS